MRRNIICGICTVAAVSMLAACGQPTEKEGNEEINPVTQAAGEVIKDADEITKGIEEKITENPKPEKEDRAEDTGKTAEEKKVTEAEPQKNVVYGKMPVILIETKGQESVSDDKAYTECTVSIENCEETWRVSDAAAGIRIRGNSTKMYEKKPYRIKFEEKRQVLGLSEGAHKSWVLLAEFNDPSLLRNLITYYFAEQLSGISYVTDCQLAEVYLNGEYAGVYLLGEQTQVDDGRIAIDETGAADPAVTDTGYLLELEADSTRRAEEGAEGEAWFAVTGYAAEEENSMQFLMERSFDEKAAYYVVKSDARSPEQMAYIKNYMIQVYDAVYQEMTKEAVEEYIDLASAVDMYLVQLIANDFDNNYSSMYLYKDAGGKLMFGAPWDFDLAYGNFNGYTEAEDTVYVYHLLRKLGEYDWFRELAEERFYELSSGENSPITGMKSVIAELSEQYAEEFSREYTRWRENLVSMGGFGNFGAWEMPEMPEGGWGFGSFEMPEMPEGGWDFGSFETPEMPEGGWDFGSFEMPEIPEGGWDFGSFEMPEIPEGGWDFGSFEMPEMPEGGWNFGDWKMPEGNGAFGGFGTMGNFSYGAVYDTQREAADALLAWLEKRITWVETFLKTDVTE